jgi:hypothetical protein
VRGGVETPFQQAKRLAERGPIKDDAELQEHVKAYTENAPASGYRYNPYGKDTYVTPEEEPDVDKGKEDVTSVSVSSRPYAQWVAFGPCLVLPLNSREMVRMSQPAGAPRISAASSFALSMVRPVMSTVANLFSFEATSCPSLQLVAKTGTQRP